MPDLAPLGVGDRDDRCFAYVRVFDEGRFDLRWIHVLAARDVHLMCATHEGDVTVRVAGREVTGA